MQSTHTTIACAVRRACSIAALAALSMAGDSTLAAPSAKTPGALEIRTLSSRPEFVSGGDTLIEVRVPAGTQLNQLRLTLNGQDVSRQLHADATGNIRGVVAGLKLGDNTLAASLTGSKQTRATLRITNYALTGPILSGKHLTPYECRTVESGLGKPLDANCSAATKVEYFYRATDKKFKPLVGSQHPADLDTTTTNDGQSVPYIVRIESGTINRTIYRIAVLDDPAVSTMGDWTPGAGWNRKLAVSFGGGAGTQYHQGENQADDVLNDVILSRGFAHIIATELVNRLHGNAVLQGETLMMLKEHFIEKYGPPKWTTGNGGSGGAIQQLLITQIYPGLLDGLIPAAAFPDSSLHTADCGLLQHYWRKADASIWTDAKKQAVSGFSGGTCASWERSYVPIMQAANVPGCALKDTSKVYHPVNNPQGARCTVQDIRANIYGRDPKTGYARKPQDNVGWQYGLQALNNGAISVDEFLDLNEKIGGNDIDGGFTAERSVGDLQALKAVYASGLMNSGGGGLANVPIIHYRGYTDPTGDIHDRERDLTIRARLEHANGRADNQVIWVGPPRARGDSPGENSGAVSLAALALDTMNEWLDKLVVDPAPLSPDKVVRHKPAAAADACWNEQYRRISEKATFDGKGECNTLYPMNSEPRLVAGAPLTNDIIKCQLKPVQFSDYKVAFDEAQKKRMKTVFSTGVCDFSKPGVATVKLKGTYQVY